MDCFCPFLFFFHPSFFFLLKREGEREKRERKRERERERKKENKLKKEKKEKKEKEKKRNENENENIKTSKIKPFFSSPAKGIKVFLSSSSMVFGIISSSPSVGVILSLIPFS